MNGTSKRTVGRGGQAGFFAAGAWHCSRAVAPLLLVAGFLAMSATAYADPPERVSVLVHLDPDADRGPVRAFAANQGGFVKYEYGLVLPNVMNLRDIPPTALQGLGNIPGVVLIEEDTFDIRINLHDSTPLVRGLQSQITGAGFSADGAGVRVCVVDTGIDSDHLMYASRIDTAAGWDFYNNDSNPEDDHGHGSHVSGIAVGGTGLTVNFNCPGPVPFQGIAPEATLIGVKVLNRFGGGFDSDIIAGIDRCADPALPGGQADVINLSIGTGQFSGPCTHSWAVAANNAVTAGVVVVAASGNENFTNALASPACGDKVIAVGATYKDDYPNCASSTSTFNWGVCIDNSPSVDDVVCFSNESDNLDVAAPGAIIWSASNSPGGSSITGMSGTSMASPQVAGLAALVLSVDPSLTPAQVRQFIRDGAIDMGPAGFDRGYGYGRIDVIDTLALIGPGCQTNADCEDNDACTTDVCSAGACSNTLIDCDDGNACTADSCDSVTGCANEPITCDDSDQCTIDSCDTGTGCVNDPVVCPPGDVCVNGICELQVCNGNGVCETDEDCNNCPGDCFSGSVANCGNGICEAGDGEDCVSCPSDCNGKQNGNPNGRFCCGDGDGQNPLDCSDPACSTGGWACTDIPGTPSCCGDLVCEGSEDSLNCEIDCGPDPCGDAFCDIAGGEDECNCPQDCGAPPSTETDCIDGVDNDCDGGTDCADPDCVDDPACACGAKGDPCSIDIDCCSNMCKRNGTCR